MNKQLPEKIKVEEVNQIINTYQGLTSECTYALISMLMQRHNELLDYLAQSEKENK